MTKLKNELMTNPFADRIRTELIFDEEAYRELTEILGRLATELKGEPALDRDLALALYVLPLVVRNVFLSFSDHPSPPRRLVDQLETAWVDLDALVTECLTD